MTVTSHFDTGVQAIAGIGVFVTVLDDGTIRLQAGGDSHEHHDLTPDQARSVAAALVRAADVSSDIATEQRPKGA